MEEKDKFDLKSLASRCGLFGGSSTDEIVQKIIDLDKSYQSGDLVTIYNYFLSVSTNPDVLMQVIRLADRFRDSSTLSYLLDILLMKNVEKPELKEKYINTRVMCAKAIANYKDTSSVTPLLYCLNNKDENYKIRLACADALGKIGDRYAVAPLIEVVKDEEEKSVYLKESAASALGMLGDLRAIEPLVSILEANKGIWNKFTFLKERVIEALGKMRIANNDRVFNALKESLLDESQQIRINAIEAIMDSEHEEAYETIKRCLVDDNDYEVQKNALIALYNLGGREILDEVVSLPIYSEQLKDEALSMIEEYEEETVEIYREDRNNQ